jgi:hypothetical protein
MSSVVRQLRSYPQQDSSYDSRLKNPSRSVYPCSRFFENPLIEAEFSHRGLLIVHSCCWWVGVLIGVVWQKPKPFTRHTLRGLSLVGVSLKDLQDQTLLDHLEDPELVDVLSNYRKKASTYSRYAKWIKDFYEDGRLYPQPKVAGAVTGRVENSAPTHRASTRRERTSFVGA